MKANPEYLSQFITEDIYLVGIEQKKAITGVFVVTDEVSPQQTDTTLGLLLSKILSSVGLSIDTINLVKEQPTHLAQSKLVLFGSDQVTNYEPITEDNNVFLHADLLSTIAESQELKKELWKGLKLLF